MITKTLKFVQNLANLIKSGKKTTTFRLFDDKNLQKGDKLVLITRNGNEIVNFAIAEITEVYLKTLETLDDKDFIGHEPVANLLDYYSNFYREKVNWESEVKVVRFRVERFI